MAYVDGYVVHVPRAEFVTCRGIARSVEAMRFDGQRMSWGGFNPLVSLLR